MSFSISSFFSLSSLSRSEGAKKSPVSVKESLCLLTLQQSQLHSVGRETHQQRELGIYSENLYLYNSGNLLPISEVFMKMNNIGMHLKINNNPFF